MGTPYTFDRGMWCHSTRIEWLYFDDNFRRYSLWVRPFSLTGAGSGFHLMNTCIKGRRSGGEVKRMRVRLSRGIPHEPDAELIEIEIE